MNFSKNIKTNYKFNFFKKNNKNLSISKYHYIKGRDKYFGDTSLSNQRSNPNFETKKTFLKKLAFMIILKFKLISPRKKLSYPAQKAEF